MMATYPPHVGGMQPGMPHGVPGMPPGTGQPMGHPMQMNANVSGAGNPHMAQAGAMMGMQPGVGGMPGGMGGQGPGAGMGMPGQNMGGPGANAMAMGHLNPQANMIQQQQQHQQQLQQQMQNNPHLFAQQQQQQQAAMIRQRQMMQQHMAMGGGPGGQMGLTPQQIAQLQSNPNFHAAGGLQPHQIVQLQQMQVQRSQQAQLQQQQQQQHAQQQAQQHAAQQAQQAQQQAQQQQQPPLQQQQQQQTPGAAPQGQGPNGPQNMAHHVAMQHAPSQTSNHSAAGVQPGQPGATGQMRAQSQAPTGPDGAAPVQTPQPLQQNQTNQQQGQQGQQAAQQNPQGQNLNASQMQQQMRQQQLMLQFQRQQQASQAAAAAAAAQSRVQGTFILKLMSFSDHLSSFSTKDRSNDIEFWQNFVHRFFAPEGRLVMYLPTSPERRPKQFTVPNSTLARYWWTYFNSGLQNLQVKMENAKENALQNGGHYVAFERTQFVFWYTNGVQVIWHGKLNAMFPAGGIDKLEVLEFELSNYDEYIPKTEVARVVSTMGSPTMTRSPKLNKNGPKQRQMSKIKGIEPITLEDFASAPINQSGCPMPVMQFLEIGETFYMMHSLMEHAQKTSLRPAEALMSVVKMFDEQAAAAQPDMAAMQAAFQPPNPPMNLQLPPQRQASLAAGGRTPMQAQMQLPQGNAFSPQVANMNLPMQMAHLNGPMAGSPHIPQNPQLNMIQQQQQQGQTGSPGSMAAPNMIPQHSAQGSTSTGASTNTSPNVAAKRRRSQVKVEDENGAEVNGRVKASPRIGGGPNKKAKA